MNLGDKVTIAGYEWTTRPFSAAEHQLWGELKKRYKLPELTLEASMALRSLAPSDDKEPKPASTRARLFRQYADELARAAEGQDAGTQEGRIKALELAAEADEYENRLRQLEEEPLKKWLSVQAESRDETLQAYTDFIYAVLHTDGYDRPFEVFQVELSPDDYATIQAVCDLGKATAPLSSLMNLFGAMGQTKGATSTNSGSSATPPSDETPEKPGKGGRSRKSSGTSKLTA